ncbi:MAG: PAS domain S-box protein [Chloroflexaceae bacterium]
MNVSASEDAVPSTPETVQTENADLRQRVAELAHMLETQKQTEDELREQVSMFTQTLDMLTDMVVIKGPHARIVYANQAYCTLYGMSPEQLTNLLHAPVTAPDDTRQSSQDDAYVGTNGQMRATPLESVTRYDGVVRTLQTRKAPIVNADGTMVKTVEISQDITDDQALAPVQRRKADREEPVITPTTESHHPMDLVNLILNQMSDGVIGTDTEGRFLVFNPAAVTMFGNGATATEQDEWSARYGLFLPDQTTTFPVDDLPLSRALRGETTDNIEMFVRHAQAPNGCWVTVSGRPLQDATGRHTGGIIVCRDITARKQMEDELRQSQERLQFILEGSNDGAWDVDMTIGRAYFSDRYSAILGYAPGELGTDIERLVNAIHPDDRVLVNEQFNAYLAGHTPGYHVEYRTQHKSGDWRWIMARGKVVVYGEDGQPQRMTGTITDLTEQKRQEAEHAALKEQVITAQRDVLRELSTPLIPITDTTVVMPLIGTIDSERARLVLETLLEGVVQHQAELVILDITGVSVVDTQVAQALIKAAQAVNLIGARVMLTGIQPQIAQTLVHLGVDLRDIQTQGTLQAGIAAALAHRTHDTKQRNSTWQPHGRR